LLGNITGKLYTKKHVKKSPKKLAGCPDSALLEELERIDGECSKYDIRFVAIEDNEEVNLVKNRKQQQNLCTVQYSF
jgi:hypothetical protein